MSTVKRKILIVDDEEELLTALGIRLELMNFQVVKAGTARETFGKISSEKPDLIVLDIHLPGINGIEICDVLKKDPETAQTPIIFLTASSDRLTEMRALEAGGFSFLTKPLDPVLFQAKIKEAFAKKSLPT